MRARVKNLIQAEIVIYRQKSPTATFQQCLDWTKEKFQLVAHESPTTDALQVVKWCKPDKVEDSIRQLNPETRHHKLNAKSSKGGMYPSIDRKLYSWLFMPERRCVDLRDQVKNCSGAKDRWTSKVDGRKSLLKRIIAEIDAGPGDLQVKEPQMSSIHGPERPGIVYLPGQFSDAGSSPRLW
mmetsp:Transcript_57145/g.150585  ORF Transcript_57145/g.150585 Transcript_57145/m.150585 type:complete len:182 (+) Transcript_57145:44-589(+)